MTNRRRLAVKQIICLGVLIATILVLGYRHDMVGILCVCAALGAYILGEPN